jgi:YD repeat-containing protein
VQKAYGTTLQIDYAVYTYSPDGKQASMTDAKGYVATMTYDGFDRQSQWNFPSPTTPGVTSTTDYEAYGYDPNGNRTSLKKRDGQMLYYSYDALNRMTLKDVPGTAYDVYYGYDLRNLQLYARYASATGVGINDAYDNAGRKSLGLPTAILRPAFSLTDENKSGTIFSPHAKAWGGRLVRLLEIVNEEDAQRAGRIRWYGL